MASDDMDLSQFHILDVDPSQFHILGTPSEPWNNPLSKGLPHQSLPHNTGYSQQGKAIQSLGPESVLAQLRCKFPFLPILPLPSSTRTLYLSSANVAQEMVLPDAAALMMLRGSYNYLVSINGNAQVPTATNNGQGDNDPGANRSWFAPEGVPLFVFGIKSISMVSDVAGTYVTAAFWNAGLLDDGN